MTINADLRGKRAFITGASSEGFGRHFAFTLSRAGAAVVIAARREAKLETLVRQLSDEGGEASAVALDVTDAISVGAVMEACGAFDIVVNNAGISIPKPFLEQTQDDYRAVLDTNLTGVWNVAQEAAKQMVKADVKGSIVNVASITGLRQVKNITPYAVSKSAVIQLTKQMALELARYGIRVNAIAPGYFVSDLTREFFETDHGKALIERIPARRLGTYENLDGPLLLLAGEGSAYMTGSVITVDGGHLVQSL